MLDSERFTEVAGTILAEVPRVNAVADLSAADTMTDGPRVVIPPPPPFGGWLRGRWARLVPLLRVGR